MFFLSLPTLFPPPSLHPPSSSSGFFSSNKERTFIQVSFFLNTSWEKRILVSVKKFPFFLVMLSIASSLSLFSLEFFSCALRSLSSSSFTCLPRTPCVSQPKIDCFLSFLSSQVLLRHEELDVILLKSMCFPHFSSKGSCCLESIRYSCRVSCRRMREMWKNKAYKIQSWSLRT